MRKQRRPNVHFSGFMGICLTLFFSSFPVCFKMFTGECWAGGIIGANSPFLLYPDRHSLRVYYDLFKDASVD